MSRRALIAIPLAALALFQLVRSARHMMRPAYESYITGDEGVSVGLGLVEKGECDKAIPILERQGAKPLMQVNKADVYLGLGKCYLALGREPLKAWTFAGLGHQMKGEFPQAEAAFDNALALNPNDAAILNHMGIAMQMQSRYGDAIGKFQRSIEYDASDPVVHANLATAYAGNGRFDDADRELAEAERLGYGRAAEVRQMIDLKRAGG